MSRTPPGPKGRPVFGSARQYARDPFTFVTALERAYGGIARFDMGPLETYVVTDPAAIQRILVSDAANFEKPAFQDDALGDLLGEGLLLSEGETWRTQRDLANPAFEMSRLSGMADRIVDHAESMVDGWAAGDVIDAEEAMTGVTLNVILDLMMGVELEEARVEHVREQLEPLGKRFEPDPIRFALPDWVPMPDDAEFEAAVAELETVIDEIVRRRRDDIGREGDPDAPMDFLSILLRARGRGEQTDEQIRDEMMTMLLAGHDTTALTLTYTWYLLSEHPEVERRVHDELDAVLGDGRPTMADVRELEYTTWTIEEAMRLYPPVYTMFRSPTRPIEIDGYTVPAGTSIMLPQWAVHRSEEYWEDPETFDPERFSPERRTDRPRFAYFPFGGGPRHCIGKHLAMLEARSILATVADRYRLEFLGESPLDLLPTLTAHPRQEMSMRVVPRET
ncbi:cytochrome P450 [Halorientalis sp. IM1011]|uniref:cytochrome P450 n=1 Tax=Halorientalis sp. IM1011 TaxID=1932360 RepID=UPI00097CC798|nr:cytochrome P450 [Halorientalis sp. IM1011]AQL43779.1 cytochrome P450 [Halorientalis sp. IM1011]